MPFTFHPSRFTGSHRPVPLPASARAPRLSEGERPRSPRNLNPLYVALHPPARVRNSVFAPFGRTMRTTHHASRIPHHASRITFSLESHPNLNHQWPSHWSAKSGRLTLPPGASPYRHASFNASPANPGRARLLPSRGRFVWRMVVLARCAPSPPPVRESLTHQYMFSLTCGKPGWRGMMRVTRASVAGRGTPPHGI